MFCFNLSQTVIPRIQIKQYWPKCMGRCQSVNLLISGLILVQYLFYRSPLESFIFARYVIIKVKNNTWRVVDFCLFMCYISYQVIGAKNAAPFIIMIIIWNMLISSRPPPPHEKGHFKGLNIICTYLFPLILMLILQHEHFK